MKIVVKQSDKYVSELTPDKVVFQYLIYVTLDDNTLLGCDQVLGEVDKDAVIRSYVSRMHTQGDITITSESEYETVVKDLVTIIPFEKFKKAVMTNEPSYNG